MPEFETLTNAILSRDDELDCDVRIEKGSILMASKLCPICGPTTSVMCAVFSALGLVILTIIGLMFYINSATLIEDITENMTEEEKKMENLTEFMKQVQHRYHTQAYNCWIAAALYLITLVVAIWQNTAYNRQSDINVPH